MPVTIKQGKTAPAKAKAKPTVKEDTESKMAGIADRLGDLNDQIKKLEAKMAPLKKEFTALKADAIDTVRDIQEPDAAVEYSGKKHAVKVGKASTVRAITDKEKLIETLDGIEDGLAFELASFTLKDVDQYLTPTQIEDIVTASTDLSKRTVTIK